MSEFNAQYFYDKIADKYNWFFSSRNKVMEQSLNEIKPFLEKY